MNSSDSNVMLANMAQLVRAVCAWSAGTAFALGVPLNLLAGWLILRHTPAEMRVYSRVLLQTCIVDLALLVMSQLTQTVCFVHNGFFVEYAFGRVERWALPWKSAAVALWLFLFYFSLSMSVIQFAYRYIILNLNKGVSLLGYLAMFAVEGFYLTTCIALFELHSYPSEECQATVMDKQMLVILGLDPNASNSNEFGAAGSLGLVNCFQTAAPVFKLLFSTYSIVNLICYAVMVILAVRMWKYIKHNLKGTSAVNTRNIKQLNKQLTLTFIIQAVLPAIGVAPVTFNETIALIHPADVGGLSMLVAMILSNAPFYWVSALNPLATIITVRSYRGAVAKAIKLIFGQNPPVVAINQPLCRINSKLNSYQQHSRSNQQIPGAHSPIPLQITRIHSVSAISNMNF